MTSKYLHHTAQLTTPLGGGGDLLDIAVHKNIRLSNVIVSHILDSDHLPIIFYILDHVRAKMSRHHLRNLEADKAARDFTVSIASAYRLASSRITLT
jgi:hypothetical protein